MLDRILRAPKPDDTLEADLAKDVAPRGNAADDARMRSGEERGEPGNTNAKDVTAPFPERPFPEWKVLVMASEAYPEMERLVMSARREVFMGLHVFQGDTAVRSDEAKAEGHEVWSDLLRAAMERGVNVRILLTDFDPAGIPELHVTAWRRVKELLESMREHIERMPDLFELQVVLPAGRVGPAQRTIFWPAVYANLRSWIAENTDDALYAPGWWNNLVDLNDTPLRTRFNPPKVLSSTTLHQKFIVVDNERGVIGGLDIDERRYDDPKHRRDAPDTWHDVTLRVDGPIAHDLRTHFAECWDRNLETGYSLLEDYIEQHELIGARATPFNAPARPASEAPDRAPVAPPSVRLLRTMSRGSDDPFALGPEPEITEIEDAYVEAIGKAKRLIYIESQYLRARAIREALAEAGRREPRLAVVIVLPGAPEDVAYQGQAGSVQRYGEYLQSRVVTVLRDIYGERLGLYAIIQEEKRESVGNRDALYGRGMVYVHAKVMTVDDDIAIVGSANINGRSMQWDTELCVLVRSEDFVRDLKRRLFEAHLDRADLADERDGLVVARAWRSNAEARAADLAASGGAVPFPERELHRFSKRSLFIPENMV